MLEIHTKRWLENVKEEASRRRRRIRDNSIEMDLRKVGFGSGGGMFLRIGHISDCCGHVKVP